MNQSSGFDAALAELQQAEKEWKQADHPGATKIRREDVEDFGMARVLEWQRTLAETEKKYHEAAQQLRKNGNIQPVQFDPKGAPLLSQGDLLWDEEDRSVYRFRECNPRSYVATTSLPGCAVGLTGVAVDRDVRMTAAGFRERCQKGHMKKLIRPQPA